MFEIFGSECCYQQADAEQEGGGGGGEGGHGRGGVTLAGGAGVDAGPVLLDVAGPLDVLAVVSPVPGAAEPLRAQLALEDARHLDAVLGLKHVTAVRDEVVDHV